MKKMICILLTLVMLISLAVPALAYETDPDIGEVYEIFGNFDFGRQGHNAKVETENFILEASYHSASAVGVYVRISAKENSGLEIKRIEARVSTFGHLYGNVDVTAGTKRETGSVNNGTIVHIDDIGRSELALADETVTVFFDMIKVYYESHEHIWGRDGKCEKCGIFKCEATGEHNAVCSYCGKELSSGNATASTLSEGNMTIVACIACAAVFGIGGFLLGRKKKPALDNSAENTDEE